MNTKLVLKSGGALLLLLFLFSQSANPTWFNFNSPWFNFDDEPETETETEPEDCSYEGCEVVVTGRRPRPQPPWRPRYEPPAPPPPLIVPPISFELEMAGRLINLLDRDGDGKADCWRDLTNDSITWISGAFNEDRGEGEPLHSGLDVAARRGKRVFSLGNGVVARIGYTSSNGYFIAVNDDNGNQIIYLHFDRDSEENNDVNLNIGDRVSVGQLIGFVGKTGSAEGYHVHVEVVENYHGYTRADEDHRRIDPLDEYGGENCRALGEKE